MNLSGAWKGCEVVLAGWSGFAVKVTESLKGNGSMNAKVHEQVIECANAVSSKEGRPIGFPAHSNQKGRKTFYLDAVRVLQSVAMVLAGAETTDAEKTEEAVVGILAAIQNLHGVMDARTDRSGRHYSVQVGFGLNESDGREGSRSWLNAPWIPETLKADMEFAGAVEAARATQGVEKEKDNLPF